MDQEKLFVLQSWYCSDVPAVCFPGIPPLDSSATGLGQLRNVGVPWLVGAMAVVYVGVFLLGKALALPAEPFMTKLLPISPYLT